MELFLDPRRFDYDPKPLSNCTIMALHIITDLSYLECKTVLIQHGYIEGIGATGMMVTMAMYDIFGEMPNIRADIGTMADIGNLSKAIIFSYGLSRIYHCMPVIDGIARNTGEHVFTPDSIVTLALTI